MDSREFLRQLNGKKVSLDSLDVLVEQHLLSKDASVEVVTGISDGKFYRYVHFFCGSGEDFVIYGK